MTACFFLCFLKDLKGLKVDETEYVFTTDQAAQARCWWVVAQT